jgi:hypothetical protein
MTKLGEEFGGFKDVVLGVTVPSLQFSAPPSEVDSEGNIYISWIGEYLKALYNFSVVVVSIIAVVMIIMMGIKIITSGGGPAKGEAYKRIMQAVIGLFIAWGSYVILFSINPDLTVFKSLAIYYIEPQTIDISTIGGSDPTDEQYSKAEGNSYQVDPSQANNIRNSLYEVCAPKNSGLTRANLARVIQRWADVGGRGGAVYVRGGFTNNKNCTSNPEAGYLPKKNIFLISANNKPSFITSVYMDKNIPKGVISNKDEYEQFAQALFAAGRICGDCITFTQQMFECAGMNNKIRIPQIGKSPNKYSESKNKMPDLLVNQWTSDSGNCLDLIEKIPGRLQFGDIVWSKGFGHMNTWVGGYVGDIFSIEIGGGQSSKCKELGPVAGVVIRNCVRTKSSNKPTGMNLNWNEYEQYTKTGGCIITRLNIK